MGVVPMVWFPGLGSLVKVMHVKWLCTSDKVYGDFIWFIGIIYYDLKELGQNLLHLNFNVTC